MPCIIPSFIPNSQYHQTIEQSEDKGVQNQHGDDPLPVDLAAWDAREKRNHDGPERGVERKENEKLPEGSHNGLAWGCVVWKRNPVIILAPNSGCLRVRIADRDQGQKNREGYSAGNN